MRMKSVGIIWLCLIAVSANAADHRLGFKEAVERFDRLFSAPGKQGGAAVRVTVGSQDVDNITLEWGKFEIRNQTKATLTVIRTETRRNESGERVYTKSKAPVP